MLNKKRIESLYLVFLAHKENGDTEGMTLAIESLAEGLLDSVDGVRDTGRKFIKAIESKGLRCGECGDWTWQDFTVSRNKKKVIMEGDCGHNTIIKL